MKITYFKYLCFFMQLSLSVHGTYSGETSDDNLLASIHFKPQKSDGLEENLFTQGTPEVLTMIIEFADNQIGTFILRRNNVSLSEDLRIVTFGDASKGTAALETAALETAADHKKHVGLCEKSRYALYQSDESGSLNGVNLNVDRREQIVQGSLYLNGKTYETPSLPITATSHKNVVLTYVPDDQIRGNSIDAEVVPATASVTVHAGEHQEGDMAASSHDGDHQIVAGQQRGGRVRRHATNITSKIKYIEMYFVLDHAMYTNHLDNNVGEGVAYCVQIVNVLDSLYKRELNTRVVLTGVEVWTSGDKFNVTNDAYKVLDNFQKYSEDIVSSTNVDNAQFVTGGKGFKDNILGLAYLGTMCTISHSCGIQHRFSESSTSIGHVMGHEIGHNLGMPHDQEWCNCKYEQGYCIMNAYISSPTPTYFSDCSTHKYKEFQQGESNGQYGSVQCLLDEPAKKKEFSIQNSCGNNVLEPGEECDCGADYFCTDACCEASTCKLVTGPEQDAKCTPLHHGCCTDQCQIAAKDSSCRAQGDECDLAETCDGENATCPGDLHKQQFYPCGKEQKGLCYNGECISQTKQCESVWGQGAQPGHNDCYSVLNVYGDLYGNCGYNVTTRVYSKCATNDTMCGTLQCDVPNWKETDVKRSMGTEARRFAHTIREELCVGYDAWNTGTNQHVGLVKDGTPCQDSGHCEQQKCVYHEKVEYVTDPKNKKQKSNCTNPGPDVLDPEDHLGANPSSSISVSAHPAWIMTLMMLTILYWDHNITLYLVAYFVIFVSIIINLFY